MSNSYKSLVKRGLASLLAGSMIFNLSSCSTILKNFIEKTDEGKAFASFVGKTYDPSINKQTTLKVPYDFYEKISNNTQDNKSTLIRIVTPGWGCPIKRYGEFYEQLSPLGKMYEGFNGLVAIVDYDPKNTLETSAKGISLELNKLSEQFSNTKLEFELLSFSHSGNIAREIVRQNYCDNIKSVRFIASPLNGTKFILPNDYILENYPFVLGLDKEVADPSFSQLLNGNKFYEKNRIILNKKSIDYYFIGIEHQSSVPFVQGGFFIPNKDDKVVPLSSQLFQEVAKYDGCNIKGIRVYQGKEIDHVNILTNPFFLEDLISWIKNNKPLADEIEDKTIQVPNYGKNSSSLLPELNTL